MRAFIVSAYLTYILLPLAQSQTTPTSLGYFKTKNNIQWRHLAYNSDIDGSFPSGYFQNYGGFLLKTSSTDPSVTYFICGPTAPAGSCPGTNEFYFLNMGNMKTPQFSTWFIRNSLTTAQKSPPTSSVTQFAAQIYLSLSGKTYLFKYGGISCSVSVVFPSTTLNSEMWVFDVSLVTWKSISSSGASPGASTGVITAYGNYIYYIPTSLSSPNVNSLWALNAEEVLSTQTTSWAEVSLTNSRSSVPWAGNTINALECTLNGDLLALSSNKRLFVVNGLREYTGPRSLRWTLQMDLSAVYLGAVSSNIYHVYDDIYILDGAEGPILYDHRFVRAFRIPFSGSPTTRTLFYGMIYNQTLIRFGGQGANTNRVDYADLNGIFRAPVVETPTTTALVISTTTTTTPKNLLTTTTMDENHLITISTSQNGILISTTTDVVQNSLFASTTPIATFEDLVSTQNNPTTTQSRIREITSRKITTKSGAVKEQTAPNGLYNFIIPMVIGLSLFLILSFFLGRYLIRKIKNEEKNEELKGSEINLKSLSPRNNLRSTKPLPNHLAVSQPTSNNDLRISRPSWNENLSSNDDLKQNQPILSHDLRKFHPETNNNQHMQNVKPKSSIPLSNSNEPTRKLPPTSSVNWEYFDITLNKFDFGALDVTYAATVTDLTSNTLTVSNSKQLSIPGYLEFKFGEDFKIEKKFAEGGTSIISRAKPLNDKLIFSSSGDPIVVKQILFVKGYENYLIKVFFQEIAIMACLQDQKYIAKFYGFTVNPYTILMKNYRGGSLAQWITIAPRRSRKRTLWFLQNISSGLTSMHRNEMVHFDLKPSNIFVDEERGQLYCVLADFGFTQVVGTEVQAVKSFEIVNMKGISASYASPEAFMAVKQDIPVIPQIFKAIDIYALAVIIHEMLNKRINWRNDS